MSDHILFGDEGTFCEGIFYFAQAIKEEDDNNSYISESCSEMEDDTVSDVSDMEEDLCNVELEEDVSIPLINQFHVGKDEQMDTNIATDTDRHFILGRDNETIWTTTPTHDLSTSEKNIIFNLPGAKGEAQGINDGLKLFSLFVTDKLIDKLVQYTNEGIQRKSEECKTKQTYNDLTDAIEIKALIGLMYMSGILKKSGFTVSDMFSHIYGSSMVRATMSEKRFAFLLRSLKFDSKSTRKDRVAEDKFAPFREFWDEFTENCAKNYTPSRYVTVDETLLNFRGKCPFKVYIPRKDKYGIRIISLCEARPFLSYFCGGIPYFGKQRSTKKMKNNLPILTQYVLNLVKGIKGTHRNVTCNSWLSSYELAEELNKNRLSMIGALHKNKREIPSAMISMKNVPVMTSRFLYQPDKILMSFIENKNENLILMSTIDDGAETNPYIRMPYAIEFYNRTKEGVEVFNELWKTYSTKRATRRWPMRCFYFILDATGVNSYILSSLCRGTINRLSFLKKLAFDLVQPHMHRRMTNPRISLALRRDIARVLDEDLPNVEPQPSDHRGRCTFCTRKKDRKTTLVCFKCKHFMCKEHLNVICGVCLEKLNQSNFDNE